MACAAGAATIFSYLGTAVSVVNAIGSLTKKDSAQPQVVQPTVAADAGDAADKATQEAAQKKLAQRRAARANSLLSEAGGAGDTSSPLTQGATAAGKLTLGA